MLKEKLSQESVNGFDIFSSIVHYCMNKALQLWRKQNVFTKKFYQYT